METKINETLIVLACGDITEETTDAIVNAANERLAGGALQRSHDRIAQQQFQIPRRLLDKFAVELDVVAGGDLIPEFQLPVAGVMNLKLRVRQRLGHQKNERRPLRLAGMVTLASGSLLLGWAMLQPELWPLVAGLACLGLGRAGSGWRHRHNPDQPRRKRRPVSGDRGRAVQRIQSGHDPH